LFLIGHSYYYNKPLWTLPALSSRLNDRDTEERLKSKIIQVKGVNH